MCMSSACHPAGRASARPTRAGGLGGTVLVLVPWYGPMDSRIAGLRRGAATPHTLTAMGLSVQHGGAHTPHQGDRRPSEAVQSLAGKPVRTVHATLFSGA